MGGVRILENNFADSEIYANIYKSSEQASFPVSNVMARIRRSKVWRSAGYYDVTSSNNVIRFRDSASTDIDATIAVGEYTSHSSFMSAVDAALEAAGAANYTVTQNSYYKFVITSDLSGGATAFQLRTADAAFTAASLLGFDTASNLTGASTYTADYLRINSSEWITFDLGVPDNPTDIAIIGARNTGLKISPNATVYLQGNTTNNWSSPEYSASLTYDDECIVSHSATGFHTTNLRYWRIKLSDQNSNGYIEIGSIFFGDAYVPTRGCVVFPFTSSYEDLSITIKSEGGQTFSDKMEKSQLFTAQWKGLTKTELEEFRRIWEKFGTSHPFFMSFDSDEAFSSAENRMCKYVKFLDEPKYELETPNNFTFTMNFREEL